MSSQGSLGSSQSEASQLDPPKERVWKLKGGNMHVGACGKKSDRDPCMTLDLVFKFDDEPLQKVVELKYDPDVLKNALNHCSNSLDTVLFMEDCPYKEQRGAFMEYIHQECMVFVSKAKEQASQEAGGAGTSNRSRGKKTIHYYKPTVEKFGKDDESKYYLIAGEVFCLTGELEKLSQEEITDLPVLISWKGPHTSYNIDEKECFKLITDIIFDMNLMQDRQFVSFPVAVFAAHLAGEVYKQIIDRRANFSSQMSVSGPASATGKSLMQTVCMLIFKGKRMSTTTSLSEAMFYEMVDEENIYVREFTVKKSSRMNVIDASFLNFAVPVIWERNERRVRVGKGTKIYQVNGVMHVDGNILLSDLEHILPDHVLGKLKLNYTGGVPLSHPQEEQLIENMLRNAKAAHEFLPVLMKLALETCVPPVSKEEMELISHVLKKPGDKREGQVIASYDRIYSAIKEQIVEHGFREPIVFQSDEIDRRSSTYFNTNSEEDERTEKAATGVIEVCEGDLGKHLVEHSARSACFRVKISDPGCFPPSLYVDLKGLKSSPSTFGGKPQRVVFLLESALSANTIARLHSLSCRYDQYCRIATEDDTRQWNQYVDRFYARAAQWGREEAALDVFADDIIDEELEVIPLPQPTAPPVKKRKTTRAAGKLKVDMLKCENEFCKDFGRVFKYVSKKVEHERASHHVNAKGPI